MANLKELRNRIASVGSTMQITSAMKMVSAAKLKRAQDAIVQLRPYANKLREILGNISGSLNESESAFTRQGEIKRVLLVIINSNRGLCGAFNANVAKKAKRSIEAHRALGREVELVVIGKKAFDAFKAYGLTIKQNRSDVYDGLSFERTSEIAAWLMEEFSAGRYDLVSLVYNQFKNAAVQITVDEPFLPVTVEETDNLVSKDYIFEPSRQSILEDLIPNTLKTQLFKAILDSNAAENGARMTAMHKATDNAKELQRALLLDYNKARQAAITNEILEIVGGAEALKG